MTLEGFFWLFKMIIPLSLSLHTQSEAGGRLLIYTSMLCAVGMDAGGNIIPTADKRLQQQS